MANRVTKVSLVAEVGSYLSAMDAASAKTRELGTEAEKLAQKKEAFNVLGSSLLAVGAVAATAVGLAVAKFADFDAAMSNVKAATQESAANMSLLRDAALDAGASTVFTASEAAGAIEELGKAGLSTAEILNGGLKGALSLAAAGQLSVSEAATVTAISLKQFKLNGDQASHVADLLAAGAGKAVGDVTDLGAALGQSGLVASQVGLSIEETTGTLAAFADAGLLGSDAGTSLKSALQRLTPQSKEAKAEMDRLGISAYDAGGNFIGVSAFAGNLQTSLKGLTAEQRNASLGIIFGSDAVRGASVLYEQGAEGIKKYIDQTNETGYAARVAADRLDNLKGDVEKLGGSLDTALIKTGAGANDILRGITQAATGMVDAFGNLPAPVLGASLSVGAVAAAIGLAGGAALIAVPQVAAFKGALDTLGISAKTAAIGLGLIGGAVAIATVGIGIFATEQGKQKAKVDALTDSLDAQSGALTDYSKDLIKTNLSAKQSFGFIESDSTYDAAEKLGISLDLITKAAQGSAPALKELNQQLDFGSAGSEKLADSQKRTGLGMVELNNAALAVAAGVKGEADSLSEATRLAEQKQKVDEVTSESTKGTADAYLAANDEASGLLNTLSQLIDTINESNGVGQDAVSANIDYQDSLQKVRDQIDAVNAGTEGYARTLDTATAAGRENYDSLISAAKAGQDAADAQFALDRNSQTYVANLQANRDAILQNAKDLGATDQQLQFIADSVVAIPDQKAIDVIANTAAAAQTIDSFIAQMGQKVGTINFRANLPDLNGAAISGNGRMGTFASGGAVAGAGTGTSDSINARLSNGEHVLTAAEVRAMGGQDEVYRFRRELRASAWMPPTPGRFANGGAVTGSGLPPIYIQSPVTGEYLLARMDERAASAVSSAADSSALSGGMGRQVRY